MKNDDNTRDAEIEQSMDDYFGIVIRPRLRLKQIEKLLGRIMGQPPVRSSLIELIRDGELEGHLTTFGWLVYEDSFKAWVRKRFGEPSATPESTSVISDNEIVTLH